MMVLLPLLGLVGCETAEKTNCDYLCEELVYSCAIDAYPDYDSCIQGCLYDTEQGNMPAGKLDCISDAQCDTFALIECENREYGG